VTDLRDDLGGCPSIRELLRSWVLAQAGTTDPDPYYRDAAPCYAEGAKSGKQWCGIFALAALRAVGLTDWVWKDRDGFLSRIGWDQATKTPEVGDVCYLDAPHQHHCVVVAVYGDGSFDTIGGNEDYPGQVGKKCTKPGDLPTTRRKVGDHGVTVYSIRKLVAAYQAKAAALDNVDKPGSL
jgi:hypothetical protein